MNVEVRKLISSIEKGTIPTGYKKTKLGIIPDEWEISTLGEVSTFKNGKAHEQNVSEDGRFIIVNSKFISTEGNEFKRSNTEICPLKKGDITLVMSDVPNGKALAKCFFINRDNVYTLNQRICSITVNRKKMDEIFSFYYLNRNNYFLRFDNGVGQTNLRKDEVLNCPVIKPPIQEQQKIASILSTWDKAIELKEKLIEQKKEQKKGLMQKLLTGEVRLPGFEGEWREVKLGKIGKTYNGLSGKTAEDFGEGKPYIPYKTIFDDSKINLQKLDYVKINIGEKQNSAKKGDIFFTTSSETPHEVGMSSVLLDDVDEIYLNSFCFGYRLNDFSVLLPNFAQHYFRSDDFRKKIYALAQGSTRFNISKNEVMKIAIKIPDLKEQEGISKILSESDKEILLLANQVRRLKEQKQGLMQLLLTGKVRVKV